MARHEWLILGVLGLVGAYLGYVGYATFYQRIEPPVETNPVSLLYMIVQLAWFSSNTGPGNLPWTLHVARFLILAVVLLAAGKGLLVIFYEQVEWLRLRRYRGQSIVCGMGRKGLFIARQLREQGDRVVVIECDRSLPDVEMATPSTARSSISRVPRGWPSGLPGSSRRMRKRASGLRTLIWTSGHRSWHATHI